MGCYVDVSSILFELVRLGLLTLYNLSPCAHTHHSIKVSVAIINYTLPYWLHALTDLRVHTGPSVCPQQLDLDPGLQADHAGTGGHQAEGHDQGGVHNELRGRWGRGRGREGGGTHRTMTHYTRTVWSAGSWDERLRKAWL